MASTNEIQQNIKSGWLIVASGGICNNGVPDALSSCLKHSNAFHKSLGYHIAAVAEDDTSIEIKADTSNVLHKFKLKD